MYISLQVLWLRRSSRNPSGLISRTTQLSISWFPETTLRYILYQFTTNLPVTSIDIRMFMQIRTSRKMSGLAEKNVRTSRKISGLALFKSASPMDYQSIKSAVHPAGYYLLSSFIMFLVCISKLYLCKLTWTEFLLWKECINEVYYYYYAFRTFPALGQYLLLMILFWCPSELESSRL